MELSKLTLDGISIAGRNNDVSEQSFNRLIDDVFGVICVHNITKGNQNIKSTSEITAHSSLLSLVLEAAKHNTDSTSISSILEDCKWDLSRISAFVNKFQDEKEQIQTKLSMINTSFDSIIDVQWRQDFVIKSNNCEKICEPSYIVSLKTWNPHINSTKDITFSCTMEQLEDLVLKLKDATKCIERNAV
ncbi:COMM domain-containing protein 3 [Trichonephila clavata]|uniref:COMM domain-containing protein 3 n=1 Tax=Trichonephila clavata TaxID=2740835 RepID=A0A8X6G3G0_TRICU|nr:COMM domain-containing protein 3 [Trichonephila clavata]